MDVLNATSSTTEPIFGFPQAAKYDYNNISNYHKLDEMPWNASMVSIALIKNNYRKKIDLKIFRRHG